MNTASETRWISSAQKASERARDAVRRVVWHESRFERELARRAGSRADANLQPGLVQCYESLAGAVSDFVLPTVDKLFAWRDAVMGDGGRRPHVPDPRRAARSLDACLAAMNRSVDDLSRVQYMVNVWMTLDRETALAPCCGILARRACNEFLVGWGRSPILLEKTDAAAYIDARRDDASLQWFVARLYSQTS